MPALHELKIVTFAKNNFITTLTHQPIHMTSDNTGNADSVDLTQIFADMDSGIEESNKPILEEEERLRNSTDPNEHLCDARCPHVVAHECNRETIHYVCPISGKINLNDIKWDSAMANKHSECETAKPRSKVTQKNVIVVQEDEIVATDNPQRESTSRSTPKSTREVNLTETHLMMCTIANKTIYEALNIMNPPPRSLEQIQQDLLSSVENDRFHRTFTFSYLHDILVEAHRRHSQLVVRRRLYRHVTEKSIIFETFVSLLSQLFTTLWIITSNNQIRRREVESFKTFTQSLLNCLHSGMRVSNRPILPQGILFFHDSKRKQRSESAHQALQQVQTKLGALSNDKQSEQFQQCTRLSKQIERMHDRLLTEDLPESSEARTSTPTSRGTTDPARHSCATSGSQSNP